MVVASLRHRGVELLGQRKGLEAYAETGSTMGIPLLFPWANRLGGLTYRWAGREVALDPDDPAVRTEESGLPIHGLLDALRGWEVAEADDRRVVAGREGAVRGFPFAHRIQVAAELEGATLTLTTRLAATGQDPVPACYGHHPYLRLPDVPRADWAIRAPVAAHLELDDRKLPTGAETPCQPVDETLGSRTFDDAYRVLPGGGPFVLAGGGRRVEVRFGDGYPYTQLFAPPSDDVVCFEPMVAPADALRRDPPWVAPGQELCTSFAIHVADGEPHGPLPH